MGRSHGPPCLSHPGLRGPKCPRNLVNPPSEPRRLGSPLISSQGHPVLAQRWIRRFTPKVYVSFGSSSATDEADSAAVEGVTDGGGPQITHLDRGQQFQASGTPTWTPEYAYHALSHGVAGPFGPLDATLNEITAVYESSEVCLRSFTQNTFLMNQPIESGRHL